MYNNYRRDCYRAIRELLAHRGKMIVDLYLLKAKNTTTEIELSRIMVDVRNEI